MSKPVWEEDWTASGAAIYRFASHHVINAVPDDPNGNAARAKLAAQAPAMARLLRRFASLTRAELDRDDIFEDFAKQVDGVLEAAGVIE